ncbi:MAG TPA: hypothetical protein VEY07_04350, partial [Thermoplasmata archaeon]|nr:hypothetical protein [Thermoplasmata archaeon]
MAAILVVAVLPTVAAGQGVASPTPDFRVHSSGTVVSPCTFTTFQSDVLAGGTVTFGAACSLTMTSAITIPSTLTVNITSGGFTVSLSGGSSNQLFIVKGGHLNITGITLQNGRATGTAGLAGTAGTIGAAGTNGVTGTSGTGGTGQSGGAGGAGTAGGNGGNGGKGLAGGAAEGGAIQIVSGTVILVQDSILSNEAVGGAGGNGATGGGGGSGGSGGTGGFGASPSNPSSSAGGAGGTGGN